jgi:hypothetical protein
MNLNFQVNTFLNLKNGLNKIIFYWKHDEYNQFHYETT